MGIGLYAIGEMTVFPLLPLYAKAYAGSKGRAMTFGIANLSRIGLLLGGPIGLHIQNQYNRQLLNLTLSALLLIAVLMLIILIRS